MTKEYVWVEIPVRGNYSLLIGNHYLKIIENYLNSSEVNLNSHLYRVVMLGDFNVPNFDWLNGTSFSNSYYYNKIKGNSLYTTLCFLGLNEHNNCVPNSALLDLVFTNISKLSVSISYYPLVAPDNYHPPLVLAFKLIFHSQYTMLVPRRNYEKGDYLLLCDTLLNSDWSCVLNENSVDSAVNNLMATVSEVFDLAIPFVKPNNSTYPHWSYKLLKYYIKKEISFLRNLRNQSLIIIIAFSRTIVN
jgi:hypothetical protein